MQDQAAIDAVLGGDKEAFRFIVERYQTGLIYYAFGVVGDEAAAHDIAQEAFITAYQKLSQYKSQFAFSTWLYRIARNLAYRDLKQHQRWLPYEAELHETTEGADPLLQAERRLLAADIRAALGGLRPEWRSIVQLYYWENKSYQEIAELLNVPVNTIRVWLRRAKDELRRTLS